MIIIMTHTVFTSQSFPEILRREGLMTHNFHALDKHISFHRPFPDPFWSFLLLYSLLSSTNLDSSLIKNLDVVNYLQLVFALWYGINGPCPGCYLHLAMLLLQREFYLQQLSLNHKTIHLYQLCSSRLHFKTCRLFDTKD